MSGPAALGRFLPVAAGPGDRLRLVACTPPFSEPFLAETIAALPATAPATSIELAALARLQPDLAPAGVVAHTGRSGSTLLCRLLDATGAVVSFREPELLAASLAEGAPSAPVLLAQYAWVASSIGAVAAVKLPSTCHPHLGWLAAGSRLLVLVRHPEAVAASLLADPPWWLLAAVGTAAPGPLAPDDVAVAAVADHWCAVARAATAAGARAHVVGYEELVARPATACRAALAALGAGDAAPPPNRIEEMLGADAKHGGPRRPRRPLPGPARAALLVRTEAARAELVAAHPHLADELGAS